MRKLRYIVGVGLVTILLGAPLQVWADTPPALTVPHGLTIAEVKMTGDEFIVLQNNTGIDIPDLSVYWLQYFNNVNPLAVGVSSSSEQLPMGSLNAGGTLLLSSATRQTCGAQIAGKLSFSLGDSTGFLQVVQFAQDPMTGALTQTPDDAVSWSSGANGMIQKVATSSKDPGAVWYRFQSSTQPAAYAWQQAELHAYNACQLDVVTVQNNQPTAQPAPTDMLLQASSGPPATIVSFMSVATVTAKTTGPSLPAADRGLFAPQISEILPNPAAPASDADGEFVELYNPNDAAFDLSDFKLATSPTRHYTFPAGTVLPAKSFKAFYSTQLTISLSNSGGQVTLQDPFGKSISQTAAYGKANDGLTWALANGEWYWTTHATPNAANIIEGNTGVGTPAITTSTSGGRVEGASTGPASSASNTAVPASAAADITPIHPWTLAAVALIALLYGAYEYRVDLANRLHQYGKYRAARRAHRH